MEAPLISVSMGVIKPLLSKLTNLVEKEYAKLKGVHERAIKFLRDELSAMSPALQMLADAEQLNPQMKDWRDKLRELAYDMEDCVDDFMAFVEQQHYGPATMGFKGFFPNKLMSLKTWHEIANQIEELKACTIETSQRYKSYVFAQAAHNSSNPTAIKSRIPAPYSSVQRAHDSYTCDIDPRLPALYEEVDRLVLLASMVPRSI